jgi:uncharacterized repeat protein (TIGR03803 family)
LKRTTIIVFAWALAGAVTQPTLNARAGTDVILHSFQNNGTDGTGPVSSLINLNGTLYGTTYNGGKYDSGTVFGISKRGVETVFYSFQNNGSDGMYPQAGLVSSHGTFYGTTTNGGAFDWGTIFELNAATGVEQVLHSFDYNGKDGQIPFAPLIVVGHALYGTTYQGGDHNAGTVFKVKKSGAESVVHPFDDDGTDGYQCQAGLIDVGGLLYGTTQWGGSGPNGGYGTVFSIDPLTKTEIVVHSFQNDGEDGITPMSGLVEVGGILYGTTYQGSYSGSSGTVFAIDPATGSETVLYSFQGGTDGINPISGLVAVNGMLYGTTESGGANGYGTVFALTTSGSKSIIYSFLGGTDAKFPTESLIAVSGELYGTTYGGGTYNQGAVFKIKLSP